MSDRPSVAKGDRLEWNPEQIATLRRLWGEGLTTAAIAAAMGTGTNSVIGKAHRLGLPGRASPIKRGDESLVGRRRRVLAAFLAGKTPSEIADALGLAIGMVRDDIRAMRRTGEITAPVTTLPALPSLAPPTIVRPYIPGVRQQPVRPPPTLAARPVAAAQAPTPVYGRVTPCCWPIGEPGTKAFRFCDDPSAPGKSYCPAHCGVAYVKPTSNLERMIA